PDGFRSEEVEAQMRREGPGRIVRTGLLAPDELDAVLSSAAVLCYPSLYEGFGLPILEAMSRGVPVVASNTSSIPEVAGDAAILVDPLDVGSLAAALVKVLSDEQTAADLAQRGRERAKRFSWNATAQATLQVYKELA